MTAAGWYDDPLDTSAYRWWDGVSWSMSTKPRPVAAVVPPGWYAHPEQPGVQAWWDGARWIELDAVEVVDLEVIDVRTGAGTGLGEPVVPVNVHHPAGWYADPSGGSDAWRWWDGLAWTGHTQGTPSVV